MSFSLSAFMGKTVLASAAKPIGKVSAMGLAGEPSIRQVQPGTISFPQDRPNSLVGYTGGWTMGNSNPLNSLMNSGSFGNTGKVSARNF